LLVSREEKSPLPYGERAGVRGEKKEESE